jgi:hypothetical protein
MASKVDRQTCLHRPSHARTPLSMPGGAGAGEAVRFGWVRVAGSVALGEGSLPLEATRLVWLAVCGWDIG